ncbi:hypothetical protein CK510_04990 [Brunnivagina elsteri CCALA 953]|uniref:Uncharacterized protein n=2 Tax=Brunnivagina TaxID=3344733 RepID=A0A2A2TMY2_9CYAN|nr:hypothetical protein CK510_04990 [Calothrix elsteri CCALA 953]
MLFARNPASIQEGGASLYEFPRRAWELVRPSRHDFSMNLYDPKNYKVNSPDFIHVEEASTAWRKYPYHLELEFSPLLEDFRY